MHYIFCDQIRWISRTLKNDTILIKMVDDSTVVMQVENETVLRQWRQHINLLMIIPHYPIPVEPSMELPHDFIRDIPAKNYDPLGGGYGAYDA